MFFGKQFSKLYQTPPKSTHTFEYCELLCVESWHSVHFSYSFYKMSKKFIVSSHLLAQFEVYRIYSVVFCSLSFGVGGSVWHGWRGQKPRVRSRAVSVSTYHWPGATQRIGMPMEGCNSRGTETRLTHRTHTQQQHTEHKHTSTTLEHFIWRTPNTHTHAHVISHLSKWYLIFRFKLLNKKMTTRKIWYRSLLVF